MNTRNQAQSAIEEFAQPKQILVATDLADCEFLLPYAIEQAKVCSAQLTLVHSLMNAGIPEFDVAGFAEVERKAEEKMAKAVERVKTEGISCSNQISHTFFPEDTVPAAVRRTGAKRLIMATHGRGRIGQIVLGSVAQRLLRVLDIPIFVVGPQVDADPEHKHFSPKRILHPVSFAQGYQESVEFARDVAELHGAQLILSHVLDPDLVDKVNSRRTELWAKNALDEAIADRTTLRLPLLTHVDCGNVIDEILHTAKVFRADWIVLGVNVFADTPILANSIAYKLMATANVPVLTLPHRVRPRAETSTTEEVPIAAS